MTGLKVESALDTRSYQKRISRSGLPAVKGADLKVDQFNPPPPPPHPTTHTPPPPNPHTNGSLSMNMRCASD